ncbi:TetR/AcrR family transcriptional regulator [Spelaeicoccus albus]
MIGAAKRAIAIHGLTGLRTKDVAAQSQLSAGAVSYYYPDLAGLIRDVHSQELDRFYWSRLRDAEFADDPRVKLCCTIRSGIPHAADDVDYQVLNEMHVQAFRDPFHARLMANLFEREVSLYLPILESGAEQGLFTLRASSLTIARNLVALEDAYGLHILGGTPLGADEAYNLIVANAENATGCVLAGVDVR